MNNCAKCHLPGGGKNFHICLDLTAPLQISDKFKGAKSVTFTDEHKARLSESAKARWARERALTMNGERPMTGHKGFIPNRTN